MSLFREASLWKLQLEKLTSVNFRRSAIAIILPLLLSHLETNSVATELVHLLQANNIHANATENECDFLKSVVDSWVNVAVVPQRTSFVPSQEDMFVLWARLLPKRCDWQRDDGVITFCSNDSPLLESHRHICGNWLELIDLGIELDAEESSSSDDPHGLIKMELARDLNIRPSGIRSACAAGVELDPCFNVLDDTSAANFNVTVFYNHNPTISLA